TLSRMRGVAPFALATAVVLAASSWFLYARLESHLALALDRDLRLHGQDLAALVRDPGASIAFAGAGHLIESGESYAQLLDRRGRVLQATPPLESAPLLT